MSEEQYELLTLLLRQVVDFEKDKCSSSCHFFNEDNYCNPECTAFKEELERDIWGKDDCSESCERCKDCINIFGNPNSDEN